MNRHQRRKEARAERRNGQRPSGLVTASGRPVASLEQRCFASLVSLLQMAARELAREGIDIKRVLAQPVRRGWATPVWVSGSGWAVVVIN